MGTGEGGEVRKGILGEERGGGGGARGEQYVTLIYIDYIIFCKNITINMII